MTNTTEAFNTTENNNVINQSIITPDNKMIFNALSNAKHIFAYKEEGTAFKILKLVKTADACKAVVVTEDGVVEGLFTDSNSATSALQEVVAVFGKEQPFIKMKIRETAKKQSVYYVEVL